MDWRQKIKFVCEGSNLKYAVIKDAAGNPLASYSYSIKEGGPTALVEDLMGFFEQWEEGQFVLELRTDQSGNLCYKHRIDTGGPAPVNGGAAFNEGTVNAMVTQGIEQYIYKKEKEEFDAEKKELQTNAGKIAAMAQPFFEMLLVKFAPAATPAITVQGVPDRDQEKDKRAFENLKSVVDSDTLLEFSQLLMKKPQLIEKFNKFKDLI